MQGPASIRHVPWWLRYRVGWRTSSALKRFAIKLTHRHCRVEFLGPARLGPGFSLDIPDNGTLIIGPGVDFRRGFVCEISNGGRVTIGALSTFTSHTLIQCTTSIDIGARAVFGQSLMIADGNHNFRDWTRPLSEQGYSFNPITIGDDATVLSKCTVVADIGDHAVIGANSVVTKPIPAYSLAVGAPARVVEYFGPEEGRLPTYD